MLLFNDVAGWLLAGFLLSAAITTLLPDDLFASGLGSGWRGMALAVVIGLPLYVCATASTPLAMAMMAKGFSAGAALVFLLVGPATNIGTIGIVSKILGKRGVLAYVSSIVFVAVVFGVMVNSATDLVLPQGTIHSHATHMESGWVATFFAVGLWGLLGWNLWGKWTKWSGKGGPRPEIGAAAPLTGLVKKMEREG